MSGDIIFLWLVNLCILHFAAITQPDLTNKILLLRQDWLCPAETAMSIGRFSKKKQGMFLDFSKMLLTKTSVFAHMEFYGMTQTATLSD